MLNIQKLQYAKQSLIGLSIGDAFGETFFGPEDIIMGRIQNRQVASAPWLFTDDTVMSLGIYNILARHEGIDQNALAKQFADNYLLDDYRGYGGTAHGILRAIAAGRHWKEVSSAVFDGMGSMGNGAAMRSAIIGAYFHEDTQQVIEQAILAAEITHSHVDAIAGAIAVALAACICVRYKANNEALYAKEFYDFIISNMPAGAVTNAIKKASTLPGTYDVRTVTSIVGNGTKLTAADTVPFALWCAANNLNNFEEALWTAVSGLGDRDTIGAITGSIVILSAPENTIPAEWITNTERVDTSIFMN